MVGIIIASHGEFANGIFQSGEMIFGKQEKVVACTLMPSDGPENIQKKMEEAISSFDDQEEILFLVDLWGGTPFNQASALIDGHEEHWAIVTGLSLPMLIETYASRFSMNQSHEIASHICEVARDGVKIKPESLEIKKKTLVEQQDSHLVNGKIQYVLARIDTRLLHGQVATAWTKSVQPNRIITVSDSVSKDELRKSMIVEAAPPGVKANVIPIDKMIQIEQDDRFGNVKAMLLFETPQDALRAIEGGVQIKTLNLGSMAHTQGKVALTKAISMSKEDIETFEKLLKLGVQIDVRKVPSDTPENFENILKKAKKEFA